MRIALGIEYDGRGFSGWQSQGGRDGCITVQETLEAAVSEIADGHTGVVCAGRTDTGVHAMMQVVHFDTVAERPDTAWTRGVNALLPESVAVRWMAAVPDEFHARFSAIGRHYTYVLCTDPIRPALLAGRVGWYHGALDVTAMAAASQQLVGRHDFSSFRSSECQAKTPVKDLRALSLRQQGRYVLIDLEADGFLHHMVRNIVGCLVYIGAGRQPAAWMSEVLAAKDRRIAAPTFAAGGLYLSGVRYDPKWVLPETHRNMNFILPNQD